jgi:hypothetical protein
LRSSERYQAYLEALALPATATLPRRGA